MKQAIKLPVLLSSNVYLKKMEGKVTINAPLKSGMIKIGYGDVGIFDEKRSRTIWQVRGEVIFNGIADIGHGAKLSVYHPDAKLILGNNFQITAESSIVAVKEIEFGKDCFLSWDILIMDSDLHDIKNESGRIINKPKKITIGDHVWIGCRSLVLKGAAIPSNTIIGANSFVGNGSVLEGSNCSFAGNPIKCLKRNVDWEK